jgi:hypothetical protein
MFLFISYERKYEFGLQKNELGVRFYNLRKSNVRKSRTACVGKFLVSILNVKGKQRMLLEQDFPI